MRFRFSLRSLVALLTVACIALWAIPATVDWYQWRHVRSSVTETMADLAALHDNLQIHMLGKLQPFCLSDHDIEWKSTSEPPINRSFTARTDAVFVVSPGKQGKWANSSHEVVRLLKQEFGIGACAMNDSLARPYKPGDFDL
jgi:hypothetical protein